MKIIFSNADVEVRHNKEYEDVVIQSNDGAVYLPEEVAVNVMYAMKDYFQNVEKDIITRMST